VRTGETVSVTVDGVLRPESRFTVDLASRTVTFVNALGQPEAVSGAVDVTYDTLVEDTFTLDTPATSVTLNHPLRSNKAVEVTVDGGALDPSRFQADLETNTITFLDESGNPEPRTGTVVVRYAVFVLGYDGLAVPAVPVHVNDNDAPAVLVTQTDG